MVLLVLLNGFTRDSLKEIKEKVTYTHTEGKNYYFNVKYKYAHAQT